jgi:thiosulfate reductase cytochrome b subunit
MHHTGVSCSCRICKLPLLLLLPLCQLRQQLQDAWGWASTFLLLLLRLMWLRISTTAQHITAHVVCRISSSSSSSSQMRQQQQGQMQQQQHLRMCQR